MSDTLRLPLDLNIDETMHLRRALMQAREIVDIDLLHRLEDHYGAIRRAEEEAHRARLKAGRFDPNVAGDPLKGTRPRRPHDERGWKPD